MSGRIGLGVYYLALWLMLGRYWGLQHDAQLYVLQALNSLAPDFYSDDIYLEFAGKAGLTIFPWVAAVFIKCLGINAGAAALTFVATAVWYGSAWQLLRAVTSRTQSLIALGMLLAIPLWYGPGQVFRIVEPFLSARPLAEALSLGLLAAALHRRHALAALLGISALAIHPLMACPAILIALLLSVSDRLERRSILLLPMALIVLSVAAAVFLGGNDRLMTDQWLELTRTRSSYLFVDSWGAADWEMSLVPLLTCVLAAAALQSSKLTNTALTASIVGFAGLLLTVLSTYLPFTLILQGQPWRWTWPSGVLSIVALVVMLPRLWSGDSISRAVGLILASAWLLRGWTSGSDLPPIGLGGLLAVLAVILWFARQQFSRVATQILLWGAYTVCAAILAGLVASVIPVVTRDNGLGTDPEVMSWVIEVFRVFAPLAALSVFLAWFASRSASPSMRWGFVAIPGVLLALGAMPGALAAWAQDPLSAEEQARFAEWRKIIPPGAQVFWHDFPQGPWFLLERPSYLSRSQLAGIVFSRDLAATARWRATALSPAIEPDFWFGAASAGRVSNTRLDPSELCAAPDLDYVVLEYDAGASRADLQWPDRGRRVYLYACNQLRPVDGKRSARAGKPVTLRVRAGAT